MTTMQVSPAQILGHPQTYITGLLVTKHAAANTLDISAGSCYDPSSAKIISYAGVSGLSAGSLGASQWNQVYLYDNAGTVTPEVINNTDPPSTAYAGPARQGGTNSNRRWLGSFLTTSGSALTDCNVKESAQNQIQVLWITGSPFSAPFRVLSAGTAASYTAVSLAGSVPRYAAIEFMTAISLGYSVTAADDVVLQLSIDGTNQSNLLRAYAYSTGAGFPSQVIWAALEASTPQIYYQLAASGGSGAGPNTYIDVEGYRVAR